MKSGIPRQTVGPEITNTIAERRQRAELIAKKFDSLGAMKLFEMNEGLRTRGQTENEEIPL